jgi:hypothetical protein
MGLIRRRRIKPYQPKTHANVAGGRDLGSRGTANRIQLAEPFVNLVPTGDVLVHQPPLMIQAEVARHSAEGATAGPCLSIRELRLASHARYGLHANLRSRSQAKVNRLISELVHPHAKGVHHSATASVPGAAVDFTCRHSPQAAGSTDDGC